MDHTMGKVLEEDYRLQRRELVALGAGVLREIDELVDEESELVVSTDLEAELEAQVAKLRAARSVSTGGFCSACGAEAVAGDRFCVRCGEPFHDEESET
jgi:hypothetical protein